MNRLSEFPEICLKWKTSRFLCPWNPHTHDYRDTYMELLKDRPVSKIVEVGLGPKGLFHPEQVAGCGLFMWQDTFPEAKIFGLDYNPAALVNPIIAGLQHGEGNITSFLCDQSDRLQLSLVAMTIGRGIDFMVDDASHIPEDQVRTAEIFVPLLSPTGVYVIEDVLPEALEYAKRWLGFKFRVAEFRTNVLPDDRMIIIEAKDQ